MRIKVYCKICGENIETREYDISPKEYLDMNVNLGNIEIPVAPHICVAIDATKNAFTLGMKEGGRVIESQIIAFDKTLIKMLAEISMKKKPQLSDYIPIAVAFRETFTFIPMDKDPMLDSVFAACLSSDEKITLFSVLRKKVIKSAIGIYSEGKEKGGKQNGN
jgi:hypothetical protein